jgi:hypothetical protein
MAGIELFAHDPSTGLTYGGLPVIPIDDDFYDYIVDEASDEYTMDIGEFGMLWTAWAKENVCS